MNCSCFLLEGQTPQKEEIAKQDKMKIIRFARPNLIVGQSLIELIDVLFI